MKHAIHSKYTTIDQLTLLRLIAWTGFFFSRFIGETMLGGLEWEKLDDVILVTALVVLAIAEFFAQHRYGSFDIGFAVVFVIFLISSLQCKDRTLIWALALIYLLRDVDLGLLLRYTAISFAILLLVLVAMFEFDLVEDVVRIRPDGLVRSSLGFEWPSRAGNYVLAIASFYICSKREKCRPWILVCLLFGAIVVYAATLARNPFAFTLLLIVGWFLVKYLRRNPLPHCFAFIAGALPLVFSFACVATAAFYDPSNPIMASLNDFMSNRLLYSNNAFHNSGITLFGCPDYTGHNVSETTTGYLDSGYLRLLMTYGLIPFILVIAVLSMLSYRAVMLDERFFTLCIIVVMLRSIMDGGFVFIMQTPILFLIINRGEGLCWWLEKMHSNNLIRREGRWKLRPITPIHSRSSKTTDLMLQSTCDGVSVKLSIS